MKGTEVSVDLSAYINPADVVAAFGEDVADRIKVSLKVNGTETTTDTTTVSYSTIASNPVTDVQIVIEWIDYNSGDTNVSDTALGTAGASKTIPVTLTVTQHVD